MERSEQINDLAAALAKAQGAIEGAKKDSANPHFKSKYADLASVWDACRSALSGNGLSVVQLPGETAAGQIEVTTMLMHSSGQWISERLTIPLQKVDAQGYGSAVTYARRYALSAMVGVAPEDDDGNAAASSGQRPDAQVNDRVRPGARQGRTTPEPLTGPIKTRAEARVRYGEIVRELHACEDADQLSAFLGSIKEETNQFERELPLAWNGDGMELAGLAREIADAEGRVAA